MAFGRSHGKALQLRVLRSRGRKLALVENKLVGRHAAEISSDKCIGVRLAHRRQTLLQRREHELGASPLRHFGSPERPAPRASVRCGLKARSSRGMPSSAIAAVNLRGRARAKLRSSMNSNPEDARRLRGRKEAVSRHADFKRSPSMRRSFCVIASTCSGFCSPINFKVMWSDSGRTHRASGANGLTPSRKRAILLRISVVEIDADENSHDFQKDNKTRIREFFFRNFHPERSEICSALPMQVPRRARKDKIWSLLDIIRDFTAVSDLTAAPAESSPAPAAWRIPECAAGRRGNFVPRPASLLRPRAQCRPVPPASAPCRPSGRPRR